MYLFTTVVLKVLDREPVPRTALVSGDEKEEKSRGVESPMEASAELPQGKKPTKLSRPTSGLRLQNWKWIVVLIFRSSDAWVVLQRLLWGFSHTPEVCTDMRKLKKASYTPGSSAILEMVSHFPAPHPLMGQGQGFSSYGVTMPQFEKLWDKASVSTK